MGCQQEIQMKIFISSTLCYQITLRLYKQPSLSYLFLNYQSLTAARNNVFKLFSKSPSLSLRLIQLEKLDIKLDLQSKNVIQMPHLPQPSCNLPISGDSFKTFVTTQTQLPC